SLISSLFLRLLSGKSSSSSSSSFFFVFLGQKILNYIKTLNISTTISSRIVLLKILSIFFFLSPTISKTLSSLLVVVNSDRISYFGTYRRICALSIFFKIL
ncbi:hypothetical protein SSS_03176, partial [Sarcoptes scabiei]